MTNSTNRGSMCSFQECKLYEFRCQYEIDYQIMIKDSRDFPPPTINLIDHCKNLT